MIENKEKEMYIFR